MPFFEKIFAGLPGSKTPSLIKEGEELTGEMGGGSVNPERAPDAEQHERQFCAGFETTLATLKANPEDMARRIEALRHSTACEGILQKLDTYFTPEHWEMTAVLQAYDERTFIHSLNVARFVYDMTSGGGETETYLRQRVNMEESSLQELYTAALFHDIGKTAIPCDILHDHQTRRDWAHRANTWAEQHDQPLFFDQATLGTAEETDLDHYFMRVHATKGYDPLNLVPIQEVFDEHTIKELEAHGIPGTATFREVLNRHEIATKAILRSRKMYIASDIASHHHDYEHRPIRSERYPTEVSAVRLGFELSILRSMDVYEALTSENRSYKGAYHPLIALEILVREAEIDFTEPELTRYVVRDLYKKEQARSDDHFANLPPESREAKALQKVLEFIRSS